MLIKVFLKCQRTCFLSFSSYNFKRSKCDPVHISSQMSNIAMVSHWSWPHLFWIMTDFWDETTVSPNDRLEKAGMLNYIKTISVFCKKREKEICTSLLNRFEEMPITFNQHSLNTYSLVRSRCSTYLFCLHTFLSLSFLHVHHHQPSVSHKGACRSISLLHHTHTHTQLTSHTPSWRMRWVERDSNSWIHRRETARQINMWNSKQNIQILLWLTNIGTVNKAGMTVVH